MRHAIVALCLLIAAQGRAYEQEVPLHITDLQLDSAGNLTYLLTNTSSQPATAWSLALVAQGVNGTILRNATITTDKYIVDARRGLEPDETIDAAFLQPNRPWPDTIAGPFASVPQLTAVALVFADATAVGDSSKLGDIFARRVADRNARRDVLKQLRDVQRTHKGVDALREASARMAVADAGGSAVSVWQSVEQDLNMELSQALEKTRDPDVSLARVIDTVERGYNTAVRHAIAKTER